MANKQQHAFASPGIYGINQFPGLSYVLSRNTVMQNSLNVPIDKDKGPSIWFARENSSKPPSHQTKGYSGPPGRKDPLRTLIASILSTAIGVASATTVAPLERIYILMQCQNEMIKSGRLSSPYRGVNDCISRTIEREGVRSLWRGNSLNVLRICVIEKDLPYALYYLPFSNYMLKKMQESPLWILPFAMMPTMLFYPFDYARTRLACDVKAVERVKFSLDSSAKSFSNNVKSRKFNGVFDVFKQTLKFDGIHGLYRGYFITCISLYVYSMCRRLRVPSSQEQGKKVSSSQEQGEKKKQILLASAVSVIILPVAFYPFRTLGRRMMMTSGEARKYSGAVDAFYQIVKTEGVSSLFKGATVFLIYRTAKTLSEISYLNSVIAGSKLTK